MRRARHQYFAPLLLAVICGVVATCGGGSPTPPEACGANGESISHGPAVGADERSARVWVRNCNSPRVAVEYKVADAEWSTSRTTKSRTPKASDDFTTVVELTGLEPSTRYELRVKLGGRVPDVPSTATFTTMPEPGSPGKLKFAIGTDLHLPLYPRTGVIEAMAREQPLFALLAGDNVVVDQALEVPFPHSSKADYEALYRDGFSRPALDTLRRSTSSFMVWDDHEIFNDWDAGNSPPYEFARAAYDEYEGGTNPRARTAGGVNYVLAAGDVELYVLDTRSFRSSESMPDGVEKTMLGASQKADLEGWLRTSDARFKFIVSSVWWNDFSRHRADAWAAYHHERDEIFAFIRTHRVGGVILLSGDEHSTAVLKLSPWDLYEFTPGPMGWALDTPQVDPQILFAHSWTEVFGLFSTDTTVCPATVRMDLKDADSNTLYSLQLNERDLGGADRCE